MTGQIINSRAEAEQFALLRGFKHLFTVSWLGCTSSVFICGNASLNVSNASCYYFYGAKLIWECRYGRV